MILNVNEHLAFSLHHKSGTPPDPGGASVPSMQPLCPPERPVTFHCVYPAIAAGREGSGDISPSAPPPSPWRRLVGRGLACHMDADIPDSLVQIEEPRPRSVGSECCATGGKRRPEKRETGEQKVMRRRCCCCCCVHVTKVQV